LDVQESIQIPTDDSYHVTARRIFETLNAVKQYGYSKFRVDGREINGGESSNKTRIQNLTKADDIKKNEMRRQIASQQ